MYKFLTNHGTFAAFGIGVVLTLAFLVSAITGLGADGYDAGTDLVGLGKEKIPGMGYFNVGLYLTLALLGATILALLVFMVVDVFKFPKATIKGLIGFAALVVIFFVLRAVAKVEVGPMWDRFASSEFNITDGISKTITAGIWVTLLLMASAALIMIVAEVRNFFK